METEYLKIRESIMMSFKQSVA